MIIPFLSGLSEGAANEFSKQSEEKRKSKADQDKLVSAALLKGLDDESLTPEQHMGLQREYLTRSGMKPKDAERIVSLTPAFRRSYEEYQRQQDTDKAQKSVADMTAGGAAPLTDAQTPDASGGEGLGDLPTMQPRSQGQTTAMAPAIPQFKGQTMGQMAFREQQPQVEEAETSKARIANQASLEAKLSFEQAKEKEKQDTIDKNIAAMKAAPSKTGKGSAWEDLGAQGQAAMMANRALPAGQTRPVFVPRNVPGSSAPKDQLEADGVTPVDHDPKNGAEYRIEIMNGEERWHRTNPDTGNILMPSENSKTGWSIFKVTRQGVKVAEVPGQAPPPAYAEQVSNGKTGQWLDVGGEKVFVENPRSTVSQRVFPGASGTTTTTGAAPAAGAAAPTAGATGGATPGTPLPKPPGATKLNAPMGGRINKTLTAKQQMDTEGSVTAMDRGMPPMIRMRDSADILNNPLVAEAIQLTADPKTGKISTYLSRKALMAIPPEERARAEQFAADVAAAMEDVNKIRSTYGATAFRGPEGFNAMVAQVGAGRLLQDPEVFRKILGKTIEDIRQFRNIQARHNHMPEVGIDEIAGSNPTNPSITLKTPIPGSVTTYKEGADTFHIPADKIKAFEAKHPNARRQ